MSRIDSTCERLFIRARVVVPLLRTYMERVSKAVLLCWKKLLIQAQQRADKERTKEIMKLGGYLIANCYGLCDYRLEVSVDGVRWLGAMAK